MSGDGFISKIEMVNALSSKGISTAQLSSYMLWCSVPQITVSVAATCYSDTVLVETLLNDAFNNFLTSYDHTFDGAGSQYINGMSNVECRRHFPILLTALLLVRHMITHTPIHSQLEPPGRTPTPVLL